MCTESLLNILGIHAICIFSTVSDLCSRPKPGSFIDLGTHKGKDSSNVPEKQLPTYPIFFVLIRQLVQLGLDQYLQLSC